MRGPESQSLNSIFPFFNRTPAPRPFCWHELFAFRNLSTSGEWGRLTVEKVQGVAEVKRKVAEFPEIRT